MPGIDDLSADQRAVISLLVRQGRRYNQVASMLRIDEEAVRGRAHAALGALVSPPNGDLTDERQGLIGDYLLGQLSEARQIEALELLFDSSSGRTWARALSQALEPLSAQAATPLPEIPPDPDEDLDEEDEAPARPRRSRRARAEAAPAAAAAAEPRAPRERPELPSLAGVLGDRGGLVLGVAAAALIAGVVVFAINPKGSSSHVSSGPISKSAATSTTQSSITAGTTSGTSSTGTSSTGTSTTPPSSSSAKVVAQIVLSPTAAGGKATGAIEVLSNGSAQEAAFDAQKLAAAPAGASYVLWLYNSPTQAQALGKLPSFTGGNVTPLAVPLPSDASSYKGFVLSQETTAKPAHPTTIVLQGTSKSTL
ncbi:MAG TPA: anti-sigma factor [Solirubrobacteraceae bacterium]|jgi:hypothetical protein|nr:anti-sigma factor [Solirubrobacteraceae bacterium]